MRDDLYRATLRSSVRHSGGGVKPQLVNVKFDDLLSSLSYLHEKACERSRVQEIENSALRLRLGLPENAVIAGTRGSGSRASRVSSFKLPTQLAQRLQPNIVSNLIYADQDVKWPGDLRSEQSTRQKSTGQVARGPPEPSAPESPRMPDIFEDEAPKPMEPSQIDYIGELEIFESWAKPGRDLENSKKCNFYSKGSEIHVPHMHINDVDLGWKCSWVIKTNDKKIMTWEVATSFLLAFDLATLPMQAFDEGNVTSDFMKTMEYISAVTWTIDMLLMFFKGYEICGDCELRWNYIISNYLRTWFLFDLLIASVDWILVVNVVSTALKIDFLRFTRLRRVLRLIRLLRVAKHAARIADRIQSQHSEDVIAVIRLVWVLVLLISINHCVACGWYAMGRLGDPGKNWIDSFITNSDREYSVAARYLLCFHWATAQFTPAPMAVQPVSVSERVYNICVIFSGLLMFSSFISAMTGSMTFLTKRAFLKRSQRDQLLNFMCAQCLSLQLKKAIYHHVCKKSVGRRTIVQSKDIESLQGLPHGLSERLSVELYTNTLNSHPLFAHLNNEEPICIQKLCHLGMSETALQPGEELFRFGVRCICMYFQTAGTCDYKLGYGEDSLKTCISTRQWFCEMSLWVHWEHRGLLTARTVAELSQLDSFEFQRIMSRSMFFNDLRRYAALYARSAEEDCGGPENIPDSWGQRLRVTLFIDKCFMLNAPSKSLAMIFFGNTEITTEESFRLWKDWTHRAKIRTRIRNPRFLAVHIRNQCLDAFNSAKLQIRRQFVQTISSVRLTIDSFRKGDV